MIEHILLQQYDFFPYYVLFLCNTMNAQINVEVTNYYKDITTL
jgi:hypothetical protein